MSKERELLNKAIEMIQIAPMMASIGNLPPDFGSELILEIQELLAQPERNWVEYQRGHSTAVLELKRNLENIFIGMGYEQSNRTTS